MALGRRSRMVGFGAVALAVAVVATLVVARATRSSRGDAFDRAEQLVRDDAAFRTAVRAGQQFARASIMLADAGDTCLDDEGVPAQCAARFEVSAHLRTLAVAVLGCTRPGIYDARRAALDYLRAAAAFDRDAASARGRAAPPRSPALPDC